MDQLLEDVLVVTMQYLDVPDLLSCRLLCKRLAAVALHRDVWRHRHLQHLSHHNELIFAGPEPEPWQRAVLRLAPCLKRMHLLLPSACLRNPLLAFTRCAVRELNLEMCEGGGGVAALLIRHQEALGRLRCLEVDWVVQAPMDDDMILLFGAVASATRLEKLTMSGMCWPVHPMARHLVRDLPRIMSAPTLKHFDCPPHDSTEPLCNLVLARQAATLEVVDLGEGDWLAISTWTSTSPSTSLTLAGMPNLRKLTTCVLLGMEAVAACGSLREVVLTVRPTMKAALSAAEAFLSRATQLRSVTLHYRDLEPVFPNIPPSELFSLLRPLVLALAATRQSCVESLAIVSKWDGLLELLQAMPGALTSLPALSSLEVGWNHWWQPTDLPKEFLLAISPATTPALRALVLTPARDTFRGQCAHQWLHYDAVNTLLSSNPSLRLVVPGRDFYCLRCKCRDCARGCHAALRDYNVDTEDELTARASGMCIPRHIPE